MKKIIVLLLALSLFTGCGKTADEIISDNSESGNSVSSDIEYKHESDTIIMFYKECYSESTVVSAKMLTFDGKIIDVTDYVYNAEGQRNENWTEKISDVLNETKAEITMPENEIKVVHDFIDSDPFSFENKMKSFGTPENDIGINYLTILKKSDNGDYSELILCKSGEKNECLDNNIVTEFCNWLNEKGYYTLY